MRPDDQDGEEHAVSNVPREILLADGPDAVPRGLLHQLVIRIKVTEGTVHVNGRRGAVRAAEGSPRLAQHLVRNTTAAGMRVGEKPHIQLLQSRLDR